MADEQPSGGRKASPALGSPSRSLGGSVPQDDSFTDERFVSLPGGSWESQSFDSSSRPSSRTSYRDRRKQFDLATPTLVDEDEAEMLSLEPGPRLFDEDVRRTPGATMIKSAYETVDSRQTPRQTPQEQVTAEKEASLGFGLTLSTPVVADGKGEEDSKPAWRPKETAALPPVARQGTASSPARTSVSHEAKGPFSFSSWTKSSGQSGRSGAFSPNTLRLNEDLDNLLQDDEDDTYPMEDPNAFQVNVDSTKDSGSDWTGTYVFGAQRPKPFAPTRNYGVPSREGTKSRRRTTGQQGSLLLHAQQPKPRRSGNEGFELGKTQAQRVDDRASPHQINFGGAFAPPGSGGFLRPVPTSGMNQPLPYGQFGIPVGAQFAPPRPSSRQEFDGREIQRSASYSPSPVYFVPAGGQPVAAHVQPSEMQATAREFVPMATRSVTPQLGPHQWPQQQVVPQGSQFEPHQSVDPGAWQPSSHSSSEVRYMSPTYGYPMQTPSFGDTRASMTPSPHMLSWQTSTEASNFGVIHVGSSQDPPGQYTRSARTPTPTQGLSASLSQDSQQRDGHQRSKREPKKGKRGKKKSQRDRADSGVDKKTQTRRKGRDSTRPGSATTLSHDGQTDDGAVSTSEDLAETRRAELVESPAIRIAFKDFYRSFRNEERISFQHAETFALQSLESGALPESVHWRVYLELADVAKRSNRFNEARRLYQRVCQLQPFAFQGWLDYSKLEEECGNLARVVKILHAGLEYCEHNETLMTRAVKLQEKMGNLDNARGLLARLRHVPIREVWKTVLEGALVEARAGNMATARRVLKYLMHHVPWYGPLYLEAYRLERDDRQIEEALSIVERGLNAIPKYGPLWFGALRLCEEIDAESEAQNLPLTLTMIDRATASISKELVWKIHLEASQMHERAALRQAAVDEPYFDALLNPGRKRVALTILTCPSNLRWKVWLAAARTELGFGNTARARSLFNKAHAVVPDKGRSATLLECARMEEFLGNVLLSRAILCKGRREYGHDWKVWLESVLLEIRDRRFARAIEICSGALEVHSGTGRLWACLVQLEQSNGGDRAQKDALTRALNAVPKSGEVWCEGARIHLNPFSSTFDLDRARRHLFFATKFTPQYGDSFVECIRLELVDQWLSPIANLIWDKTWKTFGSDSSGSDLSQYVPALVSGLRAVCQGDDEDAPFFDTDTLASVRRLLSVAALSEAADLSTLQLTCANADPNYGSFWFFCRRGASDPPRKVVEHAAEFISRDLRRYAHVYLAAIIRRKAVLRMLEENKTTEAAGAAEVPDGKSAEWEERLDSALLGAKPLKELVGDTTFLTNEEVDGSLFVAGISELNKHKPIVSMTLAERRTALFGNEALFP